MKNQSFNLKLALNLSIFIGFIMSYLLVKANHPTQVWNHLGVITETSVLRATNPSEVGHFGYSVAIDGNRLVIGSSRYPNSLSIFTRNAGVWIESDILTSPPQINFALSSAVAISGDVVIANAYAEETDRGAVVVYEQLTENVWQHTATLYGSNSPPEPFYFGQSVSVNGDTIAVTEYPEFATTSESGDVYLFERHANNWVEVATIEGRLLSYRGSFGKSIDLHNDKLVVGAHLDDHNSGSIYSDYGAAFIFERDHGGMDNWGLVAELHASDAQNDDWFGSAVAIHNDIIAITAPLENGGAQDPMANAGAVYLFKQHGNGNFLETQILRASDRQAVDVFGASVSIEKNRLIVSASGEDGGAGSPALSAGGTYLFERDKVGYWHERAYLRASNLEDFDKFGYSVGISGKHIVAGSPNDDGDPDNPVYNSGAVYLFDLPFEITEKLYLPLITN